MTSATKSIVAGAFLAFVGTSPLGGALTPPAPMLPLAAATAASPIAQAAEASAASSVAASTAPAEPAAEDAIVMDPSSGASVGGWTEIGRTPVVRADGPSLSALRDLSTSGDQLFAVGTIEETPEGPSRQVLLRSSDGITWLPVTLPGEAPVVTALSARSDGLLAGGSEIRAGDRAGALWVSPDGLAWTPLPAPPFAEVVRIVSAEAPMVVIDAADRPYVWVSDDDGEDWSTSRRLNDFSIARGPGGFLMWRGGGQDEVRPTRLLQAADATDFQEVELPSALSEGEDALGGVSVFALDDRWVLVPSEAKLPDTIFTSADGRTWEEAARPARMIEPVRWIAAVGDETQAFGHATPEEADPDELVPTPSALWSWTLGDAGAEPVIADREGDDSIDAPVPFGDGYLAVGRDGGDAAHVTVWAYGPPAS